MQGGETRDAPGAEDSHPATAWARIKAAMPYILVLGLFALGLYTLYHLLSSVDLREVAEQIARTPWSTLALAFLCTFAGYLALVGYDWSALRYIGKSLPLPVVVTGGMMAYAFGNTIGLSAVSAGAVRYRVYSGLGLDGYDVAAVSTFAAVSFGVAATLVGLGALAVHPGALTALVPLSPFALRWLAVLAIAVIVLPLVVAAAWKAELRLGRFAIRAPTLPTLGAQMVFSLGDILFSALTLYVLLPASDIGFLTFLAVFAAAVMVGIASHVPGGVGVFEAVFIAALSNRLPVEQIAAALLLFRLVYYLVPFALALVALALYETWMLLAARGRAGPGGAAGRALTATQPAFGAALMLAPLVLAAMIFGSGLWMTFAALIPPVTADSEALEALFPLAFIEGSVLLSSALGAALIVLAVGVARRSLGAWYLSLGAMAAGVVVALGQGFDWHRAVVLVIACLILIPFRPAFNRRTHLTHSGLSLGWILLVLSAIGSFGFVLFVANNESVFSQEMWWQVATDERAPRALRAGLVASLAIGIGALVLLLRAPRLRPVAPDAAHLARAARIAATSPHPDARLVLTGDKTLMFADSGDAFVMFGAQGQSWITLGGPVGAAEALDDLTWAFAAAARRAGVWPVFFGLTDGDLPRMVDLGFSQLRLGDEAVIDLASMAPVPRDAGVTLTLSRPKHDRTLIAALRPLSEAWLQRAGGRERRFAGGWFDADWLGQGLIAVLRIDGRLAGFATVLTAEDGTRATVDLIRMAPDAPEGAMRQLVLSLAQTLRSEGCKTMSLGLVPLAGFEARRSDRVWGRFGAVIFRHGAHFPTFEAMRAFMEDLSPRWEPRHLALPPTAAPRIVLADLVDLIGSGSRRTLRRRSRR